MKQLSVLNISYELIAKLLELADDHEVVNIFHEERDRKSMTLGIVIRGPKMMKAPEYNELACTWEIPQQDGTMVDIRDKYKKYPYVYGEGVTFCDCEDGPTPDDSHMNCEKCGKPLKLLTT